MKGVSWAMSSRRLVESGLTSSRRTKVYIGTTIKSKTVINDQINSSPGVESVKANVSLMHPRQMISISPATSRESLPLLRQKIQVVMP